MIKRIRCLRTANTYPYKNLAVEEYLTEHAAEGECTLFLWQNRNTVVIGRNQNCWKECKVNYLENDGGFLVRRLSGGGAVYHDLGNLNFTFTVRCSSYDVSRQLDVILRAVQMLGIHAEKSGRNDIIADGRKFSGNAFLLTDNGCYHHGTILLRVDQKQMAKYLNVSADKLAAKGVDSVKSRVVNLCELAPAVTVELMCEKLEAAFAEVYGCPVRPMSEEELDEEEIRRLTEKFESDEWKYGRSLPFEKEIARRFGWGDVCLQIHADKGKIESANIFSDAMNQDFILRLADRLSGCAYDEKSLFHVIDGMPGTEEDILTMKKDLKQLIHEKM